MKLKNGVLLAFMLLIGIAVSLSARAFTVEVKDQDGNPVTGFKWLLEVDNTHPPQPGVHLPVDTTDVTNNTLAISIHKSHAPVVASGESVGNSAVISSVALPGGSMPLPAGRYFVSVLPWGDRASCDGTFDMGGSPLTVVDNNETVTVYVKRHPIETAQLSVKVFHDIAPINGAPDALEADPTSPGAIEAGIQTMEGFTITLMDNAGDIVQDAFGNKLGTTYAMDSNGNYVLDADCAPTILTEGAGDFVTPANGEVFIKNLRPNKYGIEVEPPAGQVGWLQTTTIEGTKTIDAWVRPKEPPLLVEFGPPGWHAFFGFVKEMSLPSTGGPVTTVSGQVRKGHLSRPPGITFFDGPPPEAEGVGERCIVGLNRLEQGFAAAVYVGLCENETGNFQIPNVPPGTYQLVIWDVQLLHIITFNTVITADTGGTLDLGLISTPMWFGQQEHYVFNDYNANGVRDEGEPGIPEQNVNLRFRDGTIYKAFPTDTTGFVPFQAVFPFFHWQVAEVDFARFKATGLTVVNDDGGPVDNGPNGEGKRNPLVTTETGPVLTQAYQIFAGQNQRWEWGKKAYGPGENGGISGIVFYSTTRAEDDPRFAAGEPWEPGIPHVQVNLYKDTVCNSNGGPAFYPVCPEATPGGEFGDGIPDPKDPAATFPYMNPVLADVDNAPLGWSEGGPRGLEDVDHNGNGVFDLGDAIRITHTDSWDDNLPTDCEGTVQPAVIHGTDVPISQCAEGLRTWNQARPGLFDGGYAFGPNVTGDGSPELPAGTYIVEAATPPGYQLVKEEDRNVDFGNIPIPAILPAKCVGDDHVVPDLFSFLTRNDNVTPLPGVNPLDGDNAAPFAGQTRKLCDRKKVDLNSGQNAAADFFLYTDVPKAARAVGLLTDDFANELAPNKPTFTEKFVVPWLPIAVFDYTGQEIFRTNADEFGHYNFMAPSTYNIDLPTPSGVGPKMNQFCLNHPGPIPDGNGGFMTDPRWRPQYSTTCYQFNFEPARTTYLDTPIIRLAAFVGALQSAVDCEQMDGTPVIRDVIGGSGMPAFVSGDGDTFTIYSMGQVQVPNPDFPGFTNGIPDDPPTEPETIPRDYRFGGGGGTVMVGDYTFPSSAVSWSQNQITVTVPAGAVAAGLQTGQLKVIRANGVSAARGVTLTVHDSEPGTSVVRVGSGQTCQTIQCGIDAAMPGDLVLVDPGVYRELPILYKRIKLQGAGLGSTIIDAKHFASGAAQQTPVEAWRSKVDELLGNGDLGLLPGQAEALDIAELFDGEGPGIFVAPIAGAFAYAGSRDDLSQRARIDGFTVFAADVGGAIFANANADRLLISNNRMLNNAGNRGGGVRIGNSTEAPVVPGGFPPIATSPNPEIDIRYNHVLQNGSVQMGGGITIFDGATDYRVEANSICGNFARSGGGGIAHRGLSDEGLIFSNDIHSNEVFQGDQPGAGLGIGGGGGGIEVAGEQDVVLGGLTRGSGDVVIDANLLQGNLGGAADGGGIALRNVNGDDVSDEAPWVISIFNNMIVNNVTGLAGGGVALQDAVEVQIVHNTIARNDSTATGAFAFAGGVDGPTTPGPAGIVSRAHSLGLQAALDLLGDGTFSEPVQLRRNILWDNRTWIWSAGGGLMPNPDGRYWDLGVLGTVSPECLSPTESLITQAMPPADPAGCDYSGSFNLTGSLNAGGGHTGPIRANFVDPYFNDLLTAAAADEGGNFVQVYFTPLGLMGDYHLGSNSSATNAFPNGSDTSGRLAEDFDGDPRPQGPRADTGADEQ